MSRVIGISILVYLSYLIYSCANSVNNIEAICGSATHGMEVEKVIIEIESKNLKFNETNESILVHSAANFGRYTCTLTHQGGKVISSDFVFLD